MPTVLGVDYSHWQNPPNTNYPPDVRQMQAAGMQFVIIKAWEADNPDPNFKENWANAEADNMPRLAYVWLHESDSDARRNACFNFLGDNIPIMLDWEQEGVSNVTVEHWMDAIEKRYGRDGAIYYGLYPPDTPTARIGQWLRVFPEYCTQSQLKLPPWDGDANPDWRNCWAIWQSTEKANIDGIDGLNDLDQLAPCITIEDFVAWLDNGEPLPAAPDTVKPAIRRLQFRLNGAGYEAGQPDGLWGQHTQSAINDYSGWDG